MLLNGYNLAGFLSRSNNKLFIKGFDCCDIDYLGAYSAFFKLFSRFNGFGNHKTVCDNCYVASLSYNLALADFKLIAFIMENGNRKSSEAEINGSFIFICRFNCLLCFNVIRRADNNHTGNCTHKREILAALMACAVLTNADTCVGCADFNV